MRMKCLDHKVWLTEKHGKQYQSVNIQFCSFLFTDIPSVSPPTTVPTATNYEMLTPFPAEMEDSGSGFTSGLGSGIQVRQMHHQQCQI